METKGDQYFRESSSAFGNLRLLVKSHKTQHQIKIEIEGKLGNFGEPSRGLASSTQLAKQPNMLIFFNSTPQLLKTKSKKKIMKLKQDP